MADDSLITYENIYEILRHEKYKKELHKLDKDFIEKVAKYINEKKIILQGYEIKDSVFASQSISKTKKQLENIQIILKELYEKREGKIIQMALFNSRTNSQLQNDDILLDEEKKLYDSMINILNESRNSILNAVFEIKNEHKTYLTIEKINHKLVKFIETVPKFMGENMLVYGPFNPEDKADIPEKIADILIKNNKAEECKNI